MEACASAHHWARELAALGHEVKLMPPQYVKPYVKRGKNDAADSEAICEAVTRPTMRFVGGKSPDQQATMMLHRVRKILTRQRTQISNALRSHMAEFGIVAAIDRAGPFRSRIAGQPMPRSRPAAWPPSRSRASHRRSSAFAAQPVQPLRHRCAHSYEARLTDHYALARPPSTLPFG